MNSLGYPVFRFVYVFANFPHLELIRLVEDTIKKNIAAAATVAASGGDAAADTQIRKDEKDDLLTHDFSLDLFRNQRVKHEQVVGMYCAQCTV